MPFIQLVTSADLPENSDIPDILERLVNALSACKGIVPREVTAYHSLAVHWVGGPGCQAGMAAASVQFEKAIEEAELVEISHILYDTLTDCFLESLSHDVVRLGLELRSPYAVLCRS